MRKMYKAFNVAWPTLVGIGAAAWLWHHGTAGRVPPMGALLVIALLGMFGWLAVSAAHEDDDEE